MKKILFLMFVGTLLCVAAPALRPVTISRGGGTNSNGRMVPPPLTPQGQTLIVGQDTERSDRTVFQADNPFESTATPTAQLETKYTPAGSPLVSYFDSLQGICRQDSSGKMSSLLMLGFEKKGLSSSLGILKLFYRREAVSNSSVACDAELSLLNSLDKGEALKYHLLGSRDASIVICYNLDKKKLYLLKVEETTSASKLIQEDLSEFWQSGTPSGNLALTDDGTFLYFPMTVNGSCGLYCLNLKTRSLSDPMSLHIDGVIGWSVSPDCWIAVSGNGKLLAYSDDVVEKISIVRVSGEAVGRNVATIEDPKFKDGMSEMAFSVDGKYLAFLGRESASSPYLPYRYNVREKLVEEVCDGVAVSSDCGGLNLSSNGRYLAFVSEEQALTHSAKGTPQVCLADFGEEHTDNPLLIASSAGLLTSLETTSSGQELLFADKNNVLNFWSETDTDGMVEKVTVNNSVLAMTISGDGQRFAFAGLDYFSGKKVLKVYTVTVSDLVEESPLDGSVYQPLDYSHLALSHDGQVLFCQDEEFRLLRVTWKADGTTDVQVIPEPYKEGLRDLFCNYDGQVVAFVDKNTLKVWTTEMESPLELATLDGNDQARQLLLDGCTFIHCTNDGNIRALSMTEPGKSQAVATLSAGYQCLAFSANGRFALIKRGDNALFRLNLTKQGASPEPLLDSQGQACVLRDGAKATLNTSGTVVCFQDERGLERFQMPATGQMPSLAGGDSFSQQERCVYAPVTEVPIPLWSQNWRGAGLAVMPLLAGQPTTGQVELLPPLPSADAASRRTHYSLRFTSDEEHYYGETGISIRLFDGDDYSANLTYAVANVNDAPAWSEDIWTIGDPPFVEGEEKSVSLPSISDDDPGDQHTYTVTNASPLLAATIVDQGGHPSLRLKPDFATTARGVVRECEFTLIVQDNGTPQLQDTLKVKVSCQNKNQPPVMACGDLVRSETETGQMVFQWEDFQVSDGDAEDSELLRIVLESSASRKGTFRRRYGTASESTVKDSELSNGLLASDFPLLYVPDTAAVNKVVWQAYARDGEPSKTAKVTLTFNLKRQSHTFGDIFGYHEPAAGGGKGTWDKLHTGWNFLSLSFDLDSSSLKTFCEAVGAECVWVWDNQKANYSETQNLQAGEGFRVFVQRLPDSLAALSCVVVLPDSSESLFEATPGWHLRGAVADGDFRGSRAPDFWMKCGMPADTLEDIANCPAGTVAWLFFGTKE